MNQPLIILNRSIKYIKVIPKNNNINNCSIIIITYIVVNVHLSFLLFMEKIIQQNL